MQVAYVVIWLKEKCPVEQYKRVLVKWLDKRTLSSKKIELAFTLMGKSTLLNKTI